MEGSNAPFQENMYSKPYEMNQNDNTPLANDQQYTPPPMQGPNYGVPPPQPMQEPNCGGMTEPTPNYDATSQQQQQYGQPVANAVPLNGTPYTIVVNQQPQGALVNPNVFKTTPLSLKCTFCNKPITTTVRQDCNCCACCLCCVTGIIIYIIVQACRDKDICCCYYATHSCPYFGNVVGTYNAC